MSPNSHHRHVPPQTTMLTLRNEVLEVTILPEKGGDIYGIIDVATGIDVLFKTPVTTRMADPEAPIPGTANDWFESYAGGWQQLIPHASAERVVDGVEHRFHGEAAARKWTVIEATINSVTLAVDLKTAPLRVRREYVLDGAALILRDTVENLSTDPTPFMWVQHPAFGEPFLDGNSILETGARTLLTDQTSPGTVLAANAVLNYPVTETAAGQPVDLRIIPGPEEHRSVSGTLANFSEGWFSLSSPTAGFGMRLDWDLEVYPYAWYWQECRAGMGAPWFGQGFAIAVEPANVIPGFGKSGEWERDASPVLAAGEVKHSELRLSRFELG